MKNQLIQRILHVLYPTRCPVCSEVINCGQSYCPECRDKLVHWNGEFSIEKSSGFIAAYNYDDNISPAVMLLKDGTCGNSAFALGNALADKLKDSIKADIIIPVPIHKDTLRKRGYNQAELIAKEISDISGIPLCLRAVVKTRITREQKNLTRQERLTNLNGAFAVINTDKISGKQILLVDDVCTTGSTFTELTNLLLKNGAASVYCAACCKTLSSEKLISEV